MDAVGSPPAHYGNPLGEQRALASGEAVVDLSHRSILTLTGPDRLTWLDSLTSQSVARLAPGESSETLQLDPNGHVEFAIRLVDDGETLWLLVDEGEGEPLAAWLLKMRFMLRVEITDVSDQFATIGTFGTPDLPAAVTWHDPWTSVVAGGHQYALTPSHPAAAWSYSELVIPRSALAAAAAIPAAGTLALEALRIAAWRPRFATEVDDRSIPHELDWLRSAVHLSKGCYRGQETVAKVHNLGHPPRRLVLLHLDGSEGVLPAAGSEVSLGDKQLGLVTSSANHYELGPIALAVVKRNVDPAATLTVTAEEILIAAAQEVIVPTDAGAVADVPRLPRLGAVTR
jgi:folate-binding protein YgfZ